METKFKIAIGVGITALVAGGIAVFFYRKKGSAESEKVFRSVTSELQFYDYYNKENLYKCGLMKVPFGNTFKVSGKYLGEETIDGFDFYKFSNGDNVSYTVNDKTVTPEVCYVRKEDVYEVVES